MTEPGRGERETAPDERRPLAALPLATWRWWEGLLVVFAAYIPATVVVGLLAPLMPRGWTGSQFLLSIAAYAVVAAGVCVWLSLLHPGWREVLGRPHSVPEELWAGFYRGVVLYFVTAVGAALLLGWLFRLVTGEPVSPPEQIPAKTGGSGLLVAAVYAVLVAPLVEELVFRGVLFRAFRAVHGFPASALASAVLFGAVHYLAGQPLLSSLVLVIVMVAVGFGLAYIYERRGTILAPVFAHATFNVVGFTMILVERS